MGELFSFICSNCHYGTNANTGRGMYHGSDWNSTEPQLFNCPSCGTTEIRYVRMTMEKVGEIRDTLENGKEYVSDRYEYVPKEKQLCPKCDSTVMDFVSPRTEKKYKCPCCGNLSCSTYFAGLWD